MIIPSLLFVPANDEKKVAKAFSLPVAAVCLDLEDAVATTHKEEARARVRNTLRAFSDPGPLRSVRVNPVASTHFEPDIEAAVAGLVDAVLIPMVETTEDIAIAAAVTARFEDPSLPTSTTLIPVIETAKGVLNAREILAVSDRTRSVLFGPADFALSMGTTLGPDENQSQHGRQYLALAARAAEVDAIDGPFVFLDDHDAFRKSVETAVALGFSGKALIHPQQLPECTHAFKVSPSQLLWAKQVNEAFTDAEAAGISSLRMSDGTFVDHAIVKRARQILARSSDNQPQG